MLPSIGLLRKTFAGLVLLGAGTGISRASHAQAGVAGCRTDPIVLLSNGVKVQLYTDIYNVSTSIRNVSYVLHAPVGTTVISLSYPPDMTTTIPETFQFIADIKGAEYQTTMYVTAANASIQLTTYGIAAAPSGAVSRTFRQDGHVNQLLKLALAVPH